MKWAAQRDPSGDGPRLFHRSLSRGLERGDGPHDHPVGWCHASVCCFVLFCVILFPRCCGASKTHFSKGVPGFWDQTAIPDSGFQVQLFVMFLVISSSSSLLTNKTDLSFICRGSVSRRLTEITWESRSASVKLWGVLLSDRSSVCKTGNSGKTSWCGYQFRLFRLTLLRRTDYLSQIFNPSFTLHTFSAEKKNKWKLQTKLRNIASGFYSTAPDPLLSMVYVTETLTFRSLMLQLMERVCFYYK